MPSLYAYSAYKSKESLVADRVQSVRVILANVSLRNKIVPDYHLLYQVIEENNPHTEVRGQHKQPSLDHQSFLWPPFVADADIISLSCFFFLLYFSFFPRLISAVADWMFTLLLHMVWP